MFDSLTTQKPPCGGFGRDSLRLLVLGVLAAELAELGKFKAGLELLFVLFALIADLLALRALEFNKVFLRHTIDWPNSI